MEINHGKDNERELVAKHAIDLEQDPDSLTELLAVLKDQLAQIDSILRWIEEP